MGTIIITAIMQAVLAEATTYGWQEMRCGDPHRPERCQEGATTASGEPFVPDEVHVAVHIPQEVTQGVRIRPGRWYICLQGTAGQEVWLPVTDKKGREGLDLSPGALRKLGIEPTPYWSGTVTPCTARIIYDTHRQRGIPTRL